jgi:hypothetical protein
VNPAKQLRIVTMITPVPLILAQPVDASTRFFLMKRHATMEMLVLAGKPVKRGYADHLLMKWNARHWMNAI